MCENSCVVYNKSKKGAKRKLKTPSKQLFFVLFLFCVIKIKPKDLKMEKNINRQRVKNLKEFIFLYIMDIYWAHQKKERKKNISHGK